MQNRVISAIGAAWVLAALGVSPAKADPATAMAAAKQMGGQIFADRCAGCHTAAASKAPSLAQLGERSIEDIATALLLGPMAPQAHGLSVQQIGAVAVFVSHKVTRPDPDPRANMCKVAPKLDLSAAQWNGWGREPGNTRFQDKPGFAAPAINKLKLKWAFSYPGTMVYGQPTIIGDFVFVTSLTGRVQALDARSGCTVWTYEAAAATRTAISVGPGRGTKAQAIAYFGDETAMLHAVDAQTGALLWKKKVDDHASSRITGAPALYRGKLYVPVASTEEVGSAPPYPCCSFRGNVVALDSKTGARVWKSYTITQTPKAYGKSFTGTPLFGPAGASVWSAPTIDKKAGRLYVGTSNSYSGVPTASSDAIIAFNLRDGKQVWSNQVTQDDNFIVGCYAVKPPVCSFGVCNGPSEGSCPAKVGPDHDFGASPILRTLPNGKRVLVAGQKSGFVYGLDPDRNGHLIWKLKVGVGGAAGGIEWGMAADTTTVYVPSSDIYVAPADKAGGLNAIDIASGKLIWHADPHPVCAWGAKNCTGAQSQAVSAMPGLVFSGALDGHLRAYSAADGKVVWDTDTGGKFTTVNQGPQSGGSLNLGGATMAGGMVFVNSGYGRFAGQNGNVLLAYQAAGK